MPRLLSAVAIAGFMALAGSSAQAAPAAGLLDSLKILIEVINAP